MIQIGDRFGRLTIQDRAPSDRFGKLRWYCLCDCGNTTISAGSKLQRGVTQSCGCARIEATRRALTKHGQAGNGYQAQRKAPSAEYRVWSSMKQRCYNPRSRSYERYGAQGITVCATWKKSFTSFLNDMGPRPSPKHVLDRINNNKGYCHSNCRWVTTQESNENRGSVRWVTYQGERLTVSEWARRLNIPASRIRMRLQAGWSEADALRPERQPKRS